jgi:hypothetical protein
MPPQLIWREIASLGVMAGLVPAIHVKPHARKHVDAWVKPGHDEGERSAR